MPTNSKKPKTRRKRKPSPTSKPASRQSKTGKKIGRPEEIKPQDLLKRYLDMKLFLENNWGRLKLEITGVRNPDNVPTIFKRVPGIEWITPFKGHAICLITEHAIEASPDEIRVTRRKWVDAIAKEQLLWTEFHTITQEAQQAATAVKATISEFQNALGTLLFFEVVHVLSAKLRVQELTQRSAELHNEVRKTQNEKDVLKETLTAQEAWYARTELVEFAQNRRYRKTLLNCARALAGMPEWGWFHSRRTCEKEIKAKSTPALPYQLFEFLNEIIRNIKPLSLDKVEKMLREQLLRPDGDALLRGYVAPQWDYLQESIRHCRGVKKSELPCRIMDRFLYHCERPKSAGDIELARRNQLV